jgi:hypothetical protein
VAEVGAAGEVEFGLLRPRRVKDLGRIQLWVLHRPGVEPVALDRRLGGRWERLTEVLHDLDELREKGERLIAGARAAGEPAGGDGGVGEPSGGRAEGGDPERSQPE